ncbi:DsbA family protein [Rouxiella sp. Mn2063]|uniref:DsbA family protein n=1 Tax=Rouxiella sp. Mn2063 TaxID=3395262 RepID=UPI003BEBAB8A
MKLFTILLMLVLTPLWATAAPFTPEQEARIKQMIRETLVANPDILAQAADAWQQQADQEQGQVRSQIIKQQHKILFEDPNSPRMGAEKPALTMVLFTDYNCPYCKRFDPLLEKIIKQYPQVALVVKFLPFKGESSVSSARIALTTWKQHPEQFWALHQRLMAKKGFHDDASIAAAEQKTGVKHVEPNEESAGELAINMQLAQQLGIQGTPATLIGDELVPGAISYEQLEDVIKEQLAKIKK